MELELKKGSFRALLPLFCETVQAEESADAVVPDSKPDIARIVETAAAAELTGQEARGGRIYLSGRVRCFVLYVPEGEETVESVGLTVAFSAAAEPGRDLPADLTVRSRVTGASAAASVQNPRRIGVRAAVSVTCEGFAPGEIVWCEGVADAERFGVESRIADRTVTAATGMGEKLVNVTESAELGEIRTKNAEILRWSAAPAVTETRVIPGKVVFKGELCVDALLKTPEDPEPLTHVELSVPFSGVADCETADTDAEITASCRCVDAELTTEEEVGTGRGMMRIRAGIAVETVCERTVSAGVVTDAYSRTMTLKTGFEKLSLRCRPERRTVRIELRETVGTGTGIASVYGVSAEIAGAEIRDGTAAAGVAVGVLFRGEDGTVGRAARTLQGEAEAGPEEGLCVSGARVTGKSYRIASADEVEVRASVELELEVRRETATASLCLAEASEPAETGRRPSLTLCGALAGEDWWDLGKRMGAGVGEILAANGLDGTEPPDGRMLLIPRGGPRGGSERGSGRV